MFKLENLEKAYLQFKKDPLKFTQFAIMLALVYFIWDTVSYLKQIRAEDSAYYERQIDLCNDQLQRCHSNHVDDVKAFNYTLTRVSDHLDSLQRKK